MGIELAVFLEEIAVIAAGGDGHVPQGHHLLHFADAGDGPLHGHPPGLALGFGAGSAQFAADFHQIVADARVFEDFRQLVHGEALGDGGQVQIDAAGLGQGAVVQLELLPAHPPAGRLDVRRRRRLEAFRIRPEAP